MLEKRLREARDTATKKAHQRAIPHRTPRDEMPLSCAQQRLWFLDQLEPGSCVYNVCQAVRMTGTLAVTALERSLNEIIRRHEVLRTNFLTRDGSPLQVIADNRKLNLSTADLSGQPDPGRERKLTSLLQEEASKPFDLSRDLLMRALLIRLAVNEHVLVITMHHIVSDGWSIGVLFEELAALYESFLAAGTPALPDLPIQYADYALWERERLGEDALRRQLAYWRNQLGGDLPMLELPLDRPRPASQSLRGGTATLQLSPALTSDLKDLTQREGVTLFMTLLAAFQTLLHRYTSQEDIVIGSCVAGRTQSDLEKLIGFFVNTLVFRGDLAGDPTFRELLQRVRETAFNAFAHQDLPFEKMVEELQPERSLNRNPFFQVMFVLQNAPVATAQLPGLQLQPIDVDNGTAKFDLTLTLTDSAQGLRAALEYNADLFERDTAARMLKHFRTLLEGVVRNPNQRLSELPLLTAEEQHQLLVEWNTPIRVTCDSANGGVRIPRDGGATLHELFEAQARRTPDAEAVVCGNERLTYRMLNTRANGLAHYLRELGVGPDVFVGLCMERSADLVVGLMAILKAGGAYLPIDLAYPQERLAFMLSDAKAPVLLTQSKLAMNVPDAAARVICVDDPAVVARCMEFDADLLPLADADHLCYVIYTSGTTGRPKGSLITHRNVTRLFAATEQWYRFNERDVWTLFHSYAFDFSVWEIWGALLYGGRLVVVPYLVSRSPEAFYELLAAEQVTVLNQTPSAFRQLIHVEKSSGQKELALRFVIFGGEALELHSLKPWFERHGDRQPFLVNMYGITETTVHVTYRALAGHDVPSGSVIGTPIPDLQVYILDPHGRPVPIGVTGEMYVGGAGLGRGYLNHSELTADRFVPDPFSRTPGARLYRTGDRARFLPNRDIEYLGRVDHQVKIRGFRIELGEIESLLCGYPAVSEAVVLAR
ncbi:MAG TPA: amino acid adenylation domain-containing protein, partial [Candidatus Angelobacter sp.]|nr:amino acid adenylation domain-containing protein [Candidatus Angelobacter sp.]